MYPRQSSSTHTEALGDEASVYDWAHAQVHALNPTAAHVWQLCDGATSPDAIAAALHQELGIPEADAVVDLTLKELARLRLLESPVDSRDDRPAPTRRWLLERGLAAALLPAVYTILTPSPLEAQSPGAPGGAPTLSSVSPNQGTQGTTVAVTLTGTNFVVGATTVNISGVGVTVNTVVVGGPTSLTVNFVIAPGAATGARTVTVTTPGGTSGAQTFTINLPPAPTLTSVSPNQGIRGTTMAVTLTGTNFIVGATTVNIAGGDITVSNVVVGSTTSLTASFALGLVPALAARTVTVTTAGGTSGGQTFTINLPPPGSQAFNFVLPAGGDQTFTVPVGVASVTIVASGGGGGAAGAGGGLGGQTTATVSVTPATVLTVRVGGFGVFGGFGGGGQATGFAGRGGGASSVRNDQTLLVVAGGGGGGGAANATGTGGVGGHGGGPIADPGGSPSQGIAGGGGGGSQFVGGTGGAAATNATPGTSGASFQGGTGGTHDTGVIGGGGGGGGYFGGGGGGGGSPAPGSGGGGGGGGGGSSFAVAGATNVAYVKGSKAGNGIVTISW